MIEQSPGLRRVKPIRSARVLSVLLPDLARPDLAFGAAWLIVLAAYLPITTMLNPALHTKTVVMLGFNILTAPLIFMLVRRAVVRKSGPAQSLADKVDTKLVARFLGIALVLWGVLEFAAIAYSRGLPIIWSLTGDPRGYAEFGIPTVSGFANMLRAFAGVVAIYLFHTTRERTYLLTWFILLMTVAAEISRAGVFVFVAHGISAYLVLNAIRLRTLMILLAAGGVLIGGFVALGQVRGIVMTTSMFGDVGDVFGSAPLGLFWSWAYLVSPLANVNQAAITDLAPHYFPYFTLQPVFPTVLRALIYPTAVYPVPLVADSLNATSMYGPLVADFGFAGATLAMSLFQGFASYSYVQAKRGQLLHILLYPALFTAIVLSVFYIYILQLAILLFPVLCIWLMRYLARKRRELGARPTALASSA